MNLSARNQFAANTLPGSQGGFTLLEILAAFSVFVLAFSIALQILTGSIGNTRRSGEYTEATLWAQSVMESVGIDRPLEPGTESGEFNDKYSFELNIDPWESVDGNTMLTDTLSIELFRIEVVVYWGDGQRQREKRFVTLKALQAGLR